MDTTNVGLRGCRVEHVQRAGVAGVVLAVFSQGRSARCPTCGQRSESVHGLYVRRPADLPCAGERVEIELHVRRFACKYGVYATYLRRAVGFSCRTGAANAAAGYRIVHAVRAALTMPWSNAQSEGKITKLKLLKRLMYGRASFELLRRRVLLAA